PRRHAAPEDRVHDVQAVTVGIGLAEGGRSQAEVDLLELLLRARDDLGGGARRPPVLVPAAGSELPEVAVDEGGGRLVVEMAGGGDQDVLGPVDLLEEGGQLRALELRDAAL